MFASTAEVSRVSSGCPGVDCSQFASVTSRHDMRRRKLYGLGGRHTIEPIDYARGRRRIGCRQSG